MMNGICHFQLKFIIESVLTVRSLTYLTVIVILSIFFIRSNFKVIFIILLNSHKNACASQYYLVIDADVFFTWGLHAHEHVRTT